MMKIVNQVLRGIVIGVANIIPGVSGGTMMVSMGVYDTLIHCITHLFSEFKKSVKTLLPYLVGMLVGIAALASLLTYLFAHHPLPTSTTFIGLILGGLAPLIKKIDKKKLNLGAVALFVLFFALIIWMALSNPVDTGRAVTPSVGQALVLLVMGAIASATMIIPGVSGSMMMMLLGYYTLLINAVNDFKNAVFSFDFSAMWQPLFVLLPFGVGVLLGIYFVAKLIEWLLGRFPTHTYCAVLGLVIASPIAILLRTDLTGVTLGTILISVLTFAVGFAVAMWLAHGAEKLEAPDPDAAAPVKES